MNTVLTFLAVIFVLLISSYGEAFTCSRLLAKKASDFLKKEDNAHAYVFQRTKNGRLKIHVVDYNGEPLEVWKKNVYTKVLRRENYGLRGSKSANLGFVDEIIFPKNPVPLGEGFSPQDAPLMMRAYQRFLDEDKGEHRLKPLREDPRSEKRHKILFLLEMDSFELGFVDLVFLASVSVSHSREEALLYGLYYLDKMGVSSVRTRFSLKMYGGGID